MEKREIILAGTNVAYLVRRSSKARMIRLDVHPGARVVLVVPNRLSEKLGEKFLKEQTNWLLKNISKFKNIEPAKPKKYNRWDYLRYKEKARTLIKERIEYFNKFYGFSYKRISIKNQKTLWGSCSKEGNLNFNYKLFFLPNDARDYIIVHELCHLKELNHSQRFWKLVSKTIPNHLAIRKKLRKDSIELDLF